jgi:hypothetical protein
MRIPVFLVGPLCAFQFANAQAIRRAICSAEFPPPKVVPQQHNEACKYPTS